MQDGGTGVGVSAGGLIVRDACGRGMVAVGGDRGAVNVTSSAIGVDIGGVGLMSSRLS